VARESGAVGARFGFSVAAAENGDAGTSVSAPLLRSTWNMEILLLPGSRTKRKRPSASIAIAPPSSLVGVTAADKGERAPVVESLEKTAISGGALVVGTLA